MGYDSAELVIHSHVATEAELNAIRGPVRSIAHLIQEKLTQQIEAIGNNHLAQFVVLASNISVLNALAASGESYVSIVEGAGYAYLAIEYPWKEGEIVAFSESPKSMGKEVWYVVPSDQFALPSVVDED